MNKHVSALIAGLALCAAGNVAASHNQQGNLQVVRLSQILAQQAAGLSQQAQAAVNSNWGVTFQDRDAARELAVFAADAARLARAAQGWCVSGPGNGNGGWNGGGNNGGWNGGGHNGGGYNGGWNQPGPGQNPPGWPAPGHGNGGWNGGGNNGGWNGGGNNGGWNGGNHDQIGQQLERLFRDTWRQANDVERSLYAAPRLRPLMATWNFHVCGTLRQLRQALAGSPYAKRESLREGIFEAIFGR